jgi:pilus assembly protein CpaE
MNKKSLTVLLIEDSPEYAELVQGWLSVRDRRKNDMAFALNWTDSLTAGLNRLAQGDVDVILLDLGLPDSNGLQTFTSVRAHAPEVPVILLSGLDSQSLALQVVQEGAQDYLVKSACNGDLLRQALQYAVLRHTSQPEPPGPEASADLTRIIGVMGAKGGVGATTVACNLAVELRRQTDQTTLLADLDVHAGLVSFLMNAESEYSLLDAVSNMHRLDAACWSPMVAQATGGLHVLRSPSLLGVSEPDADKLRHVLTLVRSFYRWVVLDLGRLNSLSLSLLDRVNELFLVTTSSVPSLYEAKRTAGALRNAGFVADRLRLIVNRHANTNEVPGSELNRIFGIPVYAELPDSSQELRDACTQGKLPGENGDFRVEIARLARKMAGMPDKKPKSRVSQLLSFAGAFRKSDSGPSVTPSA